MTRPPAPGNHHTLPCGHPTADSTLAKYTGYVICGTCGPLHPKSLTDACDQGGCPRLQTCYDAFGGWCAEHGTRESVLARESAARP